MLWIDASTTKYSGPIRMTFGHRGFNWRKRRAHGTKSPVREAGEHATETGEVVQAKTTSRGLSYRCVPVHELHSNARRARHACATFAPTPLGGAWIPVPRCCATRGTF
jgi:hypothetical protein